MMITKPFTNKPEEKMDKVIGAASHILCAIQALDEAQSSAENWAEYGTLKHFKSQLEQFMSCDQGEAGFDPYLLKVSESVFRGKHNPVKQAYKLRLQYNQLHRKED